MSPRSRCALAALLVTGIAACSSSDAAKQPTGEKYLGLEEPTDGFQIRSQGETIPAGADLEFCEVGELPGTPDEEYYTSSIELANGTGSHHLIVYVAKPGTASDAKLRDLPIGHKVPCIAAEMVFGQGLENVGGIQQQYSKIEYEPGISQRFYGGQRVVWDYHYYNTTESPVHAQSAVNFHLRDKKDVKQLLGLASATNWLIDTPPGATKSFKAECRLERDMVVHGLTRHTHRWGTDFKTWFAGGPKDGEHIWTSTNFESDVYHKFEEPLVVRAGEGFGFECTFHNTQSHALRFGTAATDEMCILAMPVWDPDGAFEPPDQNCDIVWTDENGVGRTPDVAGAFPPPSEGEIALCKGGVGEAASECTQCICEECATITVKCFADEDCGPIAQCAAPTDCSAVIDEHSSGVGLSRQLGECVQKHCGAACGAG